MRFRETLLLAAAVTLCLSADAFAQPGGRGQGRGGPGGRFGGGGGPGMRTALLRVEEVRKEIELLDDQYEEVQAKLREARGGGEGRRPGGDRGARGDRRPGGDRGARGDRRPGGDRGARGDRRPGGDRGEGRRGGPGGRELTAEQRAERQKRAEEQAQREQKMLADVLLPKQLKRLNEVFVQVSGTGAIRDPLVGKQLEITDKQRDQFAKVEADSRDKMRELFQGGFDGDREAIREKFTKLREQTNKDLMGVLSDEQKKKLDELKGEKIDLPPDALRRAFGGRNRGGGGGGGRFGGGRGGDRGGDRPRRPQRPE